MIEVSEKLIDDLIDDLELLEEESKSAAEHIELVRQADFSQDWSNTLYEMIDDLEIKDKKYTKLLHKLIDELDKMQKVINYIPSEFETADLGAYVDKLQWAKLGVIKV